MRQRFGIILTIALVLGLLVVLNAASYVREVRDRKDAENLLKWVEAGGRLVVVDRRPDVHLLPASGEWRLTTALVNYPTTEVHSSDTREMTEGAVLARPSQPTSLTRDVESVMPSRFAALIKVFTTETENASEGNKPSVKAKSASDDEDEYDDEPPPPATPLPGRAEAPKQAPIIGSSDQTVSPAPVVHLTDSRGALLVDYPHGKGRIILLSDPFIVANDGITQADNLQLATNVIAGVGGLIAFDEYHQGRGATENYVISYFKGTPVLAMVAQLALIVLAVPSVTQPPQINPIVIAATAPKAIPWRKRVRASPCKIAGILMMNSFVAHTSAFAAADAACIRAWKSI